MAGPEQRRRVLITNVDNKNVSVIRVVETLATARYSDVIDHFTQIGVTAASGDGNAQRQNYVYVATTLVLARVVDGNADDSR